MTPIQEQLIAQYPTYQDFKNSIKAENILKLFENIQSLKQVVLKPRITLEDINKAYAYKNINPGVEFLTDWINFLQRFLNINKQLTEVTAVAFMIYRQYKHLYLADLKLLFEKIVYAEYGTFYGSVDAQRILYSFMQYNIHRNSIISKSMEKNSQELEAAKEKIKNKIFSEITAEGLEGEAKFTEFDKRCREELPDRLMVEFNKMNDAKEKNAPQ